MQSNFASSANKSARAISWRMRHSAPTPRPESWPSKPMAEAIYIEARRLSARYSARLGTRSLDIIEVASALVLEADSFHTFDERQRKLAKARRVEGAVAGSATHPLTPSPEREGAPARDEWLRSDFAVLADHFFSDPPSPLGERVRGWVSSAPIGNLKRIAIRIFAFA